MKKDFVINGSTYEFNNHVDECVGTGRMGLALQKEYMDQLRKVQEDIGFKHIRGHGLFNEDLGIYQEFKDFATGEVKVEYKFTYLDLVMDSYKEVGIKPFIELGFMPRKMASGDQTVFYWNGNVTPPKSYDDWCKLVTATLKHLMERYGADEVVTWPVEVWNEPNLPGFWKNADMDEYMVLFEHTFKAVKALDSRFKVGGPAICGVEDEKHMKHFMDFISEKKLPVDFITRHHYTSEPPQPSGHYSYIELVELNESLETVESSREIIDSYPEYKGLPMHITEFNTSYVPNAVIHDTNQNAAYVASLLCRLGETSESYSYWTFGDIFEEWGVPVAPFYGGFGLMANGGIKKPTYHTFAFMKALMGENGVRNECVLRNENAVVMQDEKGVYRGIVFNSRTKRTGEALDISLEFDVAAAQAQGKLQKEGPEYSKDTFTFITKTVDEDTCNPLKIWCDLGEPEWLTEEELALLKAGDEPLVKTSQIVSEGGRVKTEFTVKEFGVVYFELRQQRIGQKLGFDRTRV